MPLPPAEGWKPKMTNTARELLVKRINVLVVGLTLLVSSPVGTAQESSADSRPVNQVLEWNQIFIDTLIATNTPNSSSQRLGAIVHSAIFDA
jgi:hypothetical protein